MKRKRVLNLLRRGLIFYVGGCLLWMLWRFDVQRLPEGSCSPLLEVHPGAYLLVDKRSSRYDDGDLVLFVDANDRILIGSIGTPPASVEPDGDAVWIVTDNPECPGIDSRSLGPIPREQLRGRILFAMAG